jgi:phosphatidylserine decarboxylase
MKLPAALDRLLHQEDLNFVLTNRIPRRLATRLIGSISRSRLPVVREVSLALFELFAGDLRLDEAKQTRFASLHECFTRELKDGARPLALDPAMIVSPCDGIVGAFGAIDDTELLQAKGSPYTLEELLGDSSAVGRYRGGVYVTLRLTANMYHRFHAPYDCRLDGAAYISGDTWNVNPPALKRIASLYCKNERVAIHARLEGADGAFALVAVAAVLVASVHLSFLEQPLTLSYRGPTLIPCSARYRKGQELGYFHHGSTIIVLGTNGLAVCDGLRSGDIVRMGEPLMRCHAAGCSSETAGNAGCSADSIVPSAPRAIA